jgi:serine/threonine-protein kinase HipA
LDIVDVIVRHSADAGKDLGELYRRVAFNSCIGNSDDHFRNHGFLLTPEGWRLSPAYDMNPTLKESQSLLVSRDSSAADLSVLFAASDDYMLSKPVAKDIISSVVSVVRNYRSVAKAVGIPWRDVEMFAGRFEKVCGADFLLLSFDERKPLL